MATRRYSLVFVMSLFVAAIATVLVFQFINARTTGTQIATLPVVVAAKDIAEGAEIQEADVRVEQWPEPVVPENAFESSARVGGRVSRVPIYAGEAIVPGRLAPEGATPGLEAKIAPGKRAMGVRINDVSGMNGMIQPNSRVDILLTLPPTGGTEQRSAKTFMENMRVLAMGSEVTRGADGRVTPSTVAMIEVTPEEAERLAVAAAQGQIQLVLRGFLDPGSVKGSNSGEVATVVREYGSPRTTPRRPAPTPPPVQAPAPEPQPVQVAKPPVVQRPESTTIQVWRGPKRSDEKLTKDSVKRDTTKR